MRSNGGSSSRSGGRSTTVGAARVAAGVAATFDNVISTQTQGLFSLTNNTAIAITQSTGQGSHDFGAAAAVTTNLITDFVSSFTTNSFIGVIQSIDESRHDFRVADAIITIAELPDGSTTLTSIASCLRLVDQLSDRTGISIAAACFARSGTSRSTG